jgi:hypothetical protein
MTALMVVVIGSIFAGWATPTESGAVGVLGSMLIAGLNRRLTMPMMNEAVVSACKSNGLVFLIFLGATGFSYVFRVLGGDELMLSMLLKFGIDTKWEMLAFVMVLIFLLGFPFEWIEICLIVLPVFGPIMMRYDFSDHMVDKSALMTWFGGLVAVNLQTAFMTPPFGATLLALRGASQDDRGGLRRQPHVDLRHQRIPSVRRHAGAGGKARREDPLLVRGDPGQDALRVGRGDRGGIRQGSGLQARPRELRRLPQAVRDLERARLPEVGRPKAHGESQWR